MNLSASERAQLAPILRDPVLFTKGVLSDRPWRLQREIMQSVASHPLTAVKACHASGKTRTAADIALWWLLRWSPESLVITTAPTFRQVKLLWSEIRSSIKRSKLPYPEPSETKLEFSEKHYAIGFSTNDATRFQGFHNPKTLIIVDEATGVLGGIFDAIEGIRAGGDVRLLLLGNPTVPTGNFYDAFTRGRAIWNLFTISAFDTPNLKGLTEADLLAMDADELAIAPTPYLVTRQWVAERLKKWGPDHPMYRARVLGEFPSQSDHSVFALDWIDAAARDPEPFPTDGVLRTIQVGIDVAGPGEDETVLYARVGGVIIDFAAWADKDPRGLIVAKLMDLRNRRGLRLGPVVVDVTGIGYYLARHLVSMGFEVHAYNAGGKPANPHQFRNSKAEVYWSLREWLNTAATGLKVYGLTDDETQAQLSGILYGHTAAGQVEIESKEKALKRGQSSPDRAEALTLAFAPVHPGSQQFDLSAPEEISPV